MGSALHFAAAAVVIIGLGLLCVGFGVYDHNRTDTDTVWKKLFWIHHMAAIVILLSVVLVVLNRSFGVWPSHGVLVAEISAVYAFSLSWFAKGWELFEYNRKNPANAAGAPAN